MERPADGALASGFTRESGVTESLVEVAADPSGALVAVGAGGGIYARSAAGWTARASLPALAPLTDLCFLPNGHAFATGHGNLAIDDGAGFRAASTVPEFGSGQFGYTYATSVGCSGSRVTIGGVWSAATSTDEGKTWGPADIQKTFASAVRATSAGFLATGYWNYAGRSPDGASFEHGSMPGETQWWNGVSAATGARAVAVGEGGAIVASTDSGASWASVSSATTEDLYAVTFRGARGVAVGAHGMVITSTDDGATWTARPTHLDAFLGGVRFLDDATFVVVGERGTILRASF